MLHTFGASVDEQSTLLEELLGDIGHLGELVRHCGLFEGTVVVGMIKVVS